MNNIITLPALHWIRRFAQKIKHKQYKIYTTDTILAGHLVLFRYRKNLTTMKFKESDLFCQNGMETVKVWTLVLIPVYNLIEYLTPRVILYKLVKVFWSVSLSFCS